MNPILPEGSHLREKLLEMFRSRISEWSERKSNAPEPENDEDYWWECKAHWSMFAQAERIVEKTGTDGTREEYIARLKKAFDDNPWGSMENWGSGAQYSARRDVMTAFEGTLRKAEPTAAGSNPQNS